MKSDAYSSKVKLLLLAMNGCYSLLEQLHIHDIQLIHNDIDLTVPDAQSKDQIISEWLDIWRLWFVLLLVQSERHASDIDRQLICHKNAISLFSKICLYYTISDDCEDLSTHEDLLAMARILAQKSLKCSSNINTWPDDVLFHKNGGLMNFFLDTLEKICRIQQSQPNLIAIIQISMFGFDVLECVFDILGTDEAIPVILSKKAYVSDLLLPQLLAFSHHLEEFTIVLKKSADRSVISRAKESLSNLTRFIAYLRDPK